MPRRLTEPRRAGLLAEIRRALPHLNPLVEPDPRDRMEALGRLCAALGGRIEDMLGAGGEESLARANAALSALHAAMREDDAARGGAADAARGGTEHVDAWIVRHMLDPESPDRLLPVPADMRRLREHYLARLRDRDRRRRESPARLSLSPVHRVRLERLSQRLGHATLRETLEHLIDLALAPETEAVPAPAAPGRRAARRAAG